MHTCSRALLYLSLAAALAVLSTATSRAQDAVAEGEAIWITLGSDALEELNRRGLRFLGQPLQPEAEMVLEGEVVAATRVSSRDLSRISELLHETRLRCPGFMAHRSRADALRSLEAAESAAASEGTASFEINQAPLVADLVSRLDEGSILTTIEHLSTSYANRFYQHPSGVASATWIRDRWQSLALGRSDVTVEFFDHSWPQPSVILTLEGTTPGEVVVLGGHQDSVAPGNSNPNFSAPGADDNASGIAVLTEVIRAAMEAGYQPDRTVHFMAYAAEEVGLWGSQEIAAEFSAANVDVVAVLQLDMTAYQGSAQDIGFLSDFTNGPLTSFAKSLVDTYQPELNWVDTACGYGCSDHAAWHNEGFPTVMSAESIVGQHNPTIHSTSDTLSFFGDTADHSIKFARLAAALMVEIAGSAANSIVFEDDFESGDLSAWSVAVP